MLIAHLSDLHLRDAGDAVWLERQLDRIAARSPSHLAITGDLLDRWSPPLLERVLDALDATGWLHPDRVTILHGNHDLASSGGYPRERRDLWRLAVRSWDPPPLVASRRRRFYEAIARRSAGIARQGPFTKALPSPATIAVVDTVPAFWRPWDLDRRSIVTRHSIGCVAASQAAWLARQRTGDGPLIALMHHYPLQGGAYEWQAPRRLRWLLASVRVPTDIQEPGRRALLDAAQRAGVALILCGHVHRARLEHHGRMAVGLNGQSGAEWAGRTIAFYDLTDRGVTMETEATI